MSLIAWPKLARCLDATQLLSFAQVCCVRPPNDIQIYGASIRDPYLYQAWPIAGLRQGPMQHFGLHRD